MKGGITAIYCDVFIHDKSKLLLFALQGQEYIFCLLNNLTSIIFSIPPLERR